MRLRFERRFEKQFRRLPSQIQDRATKALAAFAGGGDRPGLNLEKLRGFEGVFSIRVTAGYRILLRRDRDDAGEVWTATHIGPHDVYRDL